MTQDNGVDAHITGSVGTFNQVGTNTGVININVENGKGPTAPRLAPPRLPDALIGRDDVLAAIKERLFEGQNVALLHLPGVGKTALAVQLAYDKEVLAHFPDGILWADLGIGSDVLKSLNRWAVALGLTVPEMGDTGDLAEKTAALVGAMQAAIGNQRMLLVVDDAWGVEEARTFLIGGSNCGHLVTTRLSDVASELATEGLTTMVDALDEDFGLKLLAKNAPKVVANEPEKSRELVRAVGGLPLALVLLGKYLSERSVNGDPDLIRLTLTELHQAKQRLERGPKSPSGGPKFPSERYVSLSAAIEVSDRALPEDARLLLHALSIFRPKPHTFTLKAAQAVFDPTGEKTLDEFVDVLEPLGRYGLLEAQDGHYSLHPCISEYAQAQMTDEAVQDCRKRAVAYYDVWLRDYEDTKSAVGSYRYESPDWQEAMCEWLYQLAQTSDRSKAGLAFANTFFDAFWWWGFYVKFPFCEELLTQWEQTQTTPDDQDWLRLLRQFQGVFPPYHENKGKGDWKSVAESLLALRQFAKIDGDLVDLADPGERHLRAITDIFLAEAVRRSELHDPRAETLLQESMSLLTEGGKDEAWNKPWILFHLARLYLDRGQLDLARENSEQSLRLAQDAGLADTERDCEIIANAYRVLADICWQKGDLDAAFPHYARAVFYAFSFQAIPKSPPDFYTVAFYGEMTDRTLARLRTLWQEGRQAEAQKYAAALHDLWLPNLAGTAPPAETLPLTTLMAGNNENELTAYLFPPSPAQAEGLDSEYLPIDAALLKAITLRMEKDF